MPFHRRPLHPGLISAAEEWGRTEGQMTPVERQKEMHRQRAMAGDPNYASIRPPQSRDDRILDNLRYRLPRMVGDAFKGATAGPVAGALRIGQALIPGEQPRMAEFGEYALDQIPESGIGKVTGLIGSFAPEFTMAGDVADLGRAFRHLTNREDGRWDPEWGSAGLSSLAAIPFVGTPAAKILQAKKLQKAAMEAARVAEEAARVAREEAMVARVAARYLPEPIAPAPLERSVTASDLYPKDPELQGLLEVTEAAGVAQEAQRAVRDMSDDTVRRILYANDSNGEWENLTGPELREAFAAFEAEDPVEWAAFLDDPATRLDVPELRTGALPPSVAEGTPLVAEIGGDRSLLLTRNTSPDQGQWRITPVVGDTDISRGQHWAYETYDEAAQALAGSADDVKPLSASGGLLAATETAGVAQGAQRAARGAEPPISQAQEAQNAIIDRVIESPNIQRLIQTPAAEAAEGQRNLRGIMDYEAPKIQGTMEDVSVFDPPPGYRGAPHPFTERLLNSRTIPQVLDADFERGLEIMGPRAALNWYELGPARQFMDELGGPYSFDDLNLIGGAASVQTPVHQEIANTAIIMFARKRGISIDEAIDEYFKVTRRPRGVTPEGLPARPWGLSGDTYARAGRYLEEGVAAPVDYRGPDWKVPSYVGARQGAGASPFANPALDTHERRRIWQGIQANPRLRRLAEEGLTPAMRADELMPIRNAADYSRISDLYRGGQDRYGLITPAQYQAPRWVGGGEATGLATSPTETFVEILADVTAATASDRGLGTSARELRELLGRALSGDDFLIHYPSARELRESVSRVPR